MWFPGFVTVPRGIQSDGMEFVSTKYEMMAALLKSYDFQLLFQYDSGIQWEDGRVYGTLIKC